MDRSQPLAPADGNSKSSSATNPLNPLSDPNSKPTAAFADESKQHEKLHNKLMKQEKTGKQAGSYVSPSDDIMSPASAKLNAFKEKRFTKSAKPRTLFAKTKIMSNSSLHGASPTEETADS